MVDILQALAAAGSPLPEPVRGGEDDVLRGIRDVRFACRTVCPRCGSDRCIRWGSFSGRQRYRCGGCGRTFSDLTGTPVSYSKRLSCWAGYLSCFRHALPVRAAARAVGVHTSTAFRWRHRLLASMSVHDAAWLSGLVELRDVNFPVSRKGRSVRGSPARRRGTRFTRAWEDTPRHRVIFARDRAGACAAFILATQTTTAISLAPWLARRIRPGALLLLGAVTWGSHRAAARSCGMDLRPVTGAGRFAEDRRHHVRNVVPFSERAFAWLRRFRGVATRYIENYLRWHRLLDPATAEGWLHDCFGRMIPAAGTMSHQQFRRTEPDRLARG